MTPHEDLNMTTLHTLVTLVSENLVPARTHEVRRTGVRDIKASEAEVDLLRDVFGWFVCIC